MLDNVKNRKLTLILDLDHTVIQAVKVGKEFKIEDLLNKDLHEVVMSGTERYMVKVRQFMQYFVKHISQAYEVFIYTQSLRAYAIKICKLIDPGGLLKLTEARILSRTEDDSP